MLQRNLDADLRLTHIITVVELTKII